MLSNNFLAKLLYTWYRRDTWCVGFGKYEDFTKIFKLSTMPVPTLSNYSCVVVQSQIVSPSLIERMFCLELTVRKLMTDEEFLRLQKLSAENAPEQLEMSSPFLSNSK